MYWFTVPFNSVSWGTKGKHLLHHRSVPIFLHAKPCCLFYIGSDKADALPSVKSSSEKGEGAVVEETEKTAEDLDTTFKEVVSRAMKPVVVTEVVEKPTMDDENKTFRTRLVTIWLLTNGALVITIM